MIANMVCARLDGELQRLSKKYGCTYTRYADDISISSNRRDFPSQIADPAGGWSGSSLLLGQELLAVIESNKFKVNEAKQRLQFRSKRQEVTGVVVNRFPNVKRRYLSQIRAMIHSWRTIGIDDAQTLHETKFRPDSPTYSVDFSRVVRGKLEYVRMLKGENDKVYRRLARALHDADPSMIDYLADLAEPPADTLWRELREKYEHSVFQISVKREMGTLTQVQHLFGRRE